MDIHSAMKSGLLGVLLLGVLAPGAQAQTSISLAVVPPVTTFGQPVTLTAVVSAPANATGKMTFYQDSRLLGTQPVISGQAVLVTSQIQAGKRTLKAFYSGDSLHGTAFSPIVPATVAALAGQGFPATANYSAGQAPGWTAVADFNLDGKQDVAVVTENNVYVFLGNGNGTFGSPVVLGAGGFATCIAAGDFNGDGKPDLAILNNDVESGTGIGYIYLGNGNGSFQPATSFATGPGAIDLVVADFNLDGKADLAIANAGTSLDVSILLGNGNGTFQPYTSLATSSNTTGALGIAVADFNRDGIPDLAVAEQNLVILTGSGFGTFSITSTLQVGNNPSSSALSDVEVGDFNGDGIFDVAVPDFIGGTVSIFLGQGNGGFQQQDVSAAGESPYFLSVGDFNGDGVQDLAVLDLGDYISVQPSVSVMLGQGDGLFQAPVPYYTGVNPFMLAQGEFNGDGVADLVYPDAGDFGTNPGSLSVLLGSACAVTPSLGSPLAFGNAGGAGSITFSTGNPNCGSQTFSTVPWITAQPASGTGNYTVSLAVAANTTGADRSGGILAAGQNFSVLQDFTAQVFSDVPPSASYFDAVNLLSQHGITTGCAPDEFCPSQDVTRAQMAIFIVRAVLGTDAFSYSQTPLFSDVPLGAYGFQWIQKFGEMGITTGCGAGQFCPDQTITRAQMAIFIIRARYGAETNFSYFGTPIFSDVPSGAFGFAWIQRFGMDTITTGCAVGLFCPNDAVTRGEMAVFIMRGAFNALLPSTEPIIIAVSPQTLTHATMGTFTVTGVNTNFVQGQTVIYGINGAVVNSITVSSPTTLTANITAPLVPLQQPMALYVIGTPEAVFPNAIAVP